MIYRKGKPNDIYDVDALLYVQESQLDKYKQELASLNAIANVSQVMINSYSGRNGNVFGAYQSFCGRGTSTCGTGRGRQVYIIGNRPTCQLCNKYGHLVID